MISRLIDINIKPYTTKEPAIIKSVKTNFSIKDYANAFLSGLEKNQLNRFKKMLENNIEAGKSIANSYNIDYNKFITEIKKQLNIKEVV